MDRKFAVLGDIHANLDALNAVIDDARAKGVTDFVSVGDVVGYNACPSECIKRIRQLGCLTVRGNHDHYCSYDDESLDDFQPLAASVIAWTRRQLSEDDVKWLHDLPYSKLHCGFTLVHSTLDMPEHWGYVFDVLAAEANFSYQATNLCFHGHTHVPMIYRRVHDIMRVEPCKFKIGFGEKYFVNVGSVGQPRDGDPRSAYVLFSAKTKEVEFVRVAYDVEAAMERNRKAGLPERLALRLSVGR